MFAEKIPDEIDLNDFISFDLRELKNVGYYATEEPEFLEIPTRSKRLHETKNLRPLFLVPAIDANFIQPLASKLLYPAFCATFTEQHEIPTKTAKKLFQVNEQTFFRQEIFSKQKEPEIIFTLNTKYTNVFL